MLSNKKIIVLTIFLLVVLNILTLINQRSLRKNFEQQINNLNSQIGDLNGQLSNQVNVISQSLNKFNEDQKWVNRSSYKFEGYDSGPKLINTEISWSFREITPKSTVYLAYGELESNSQIVDNWRRVKAAGSDLLNYKAVVALSPDRNYIFKAQVENNSEVKGEEIMNIDMIGAVQNRFSIMPVMGANMGPRYENHLMVVNNNHGQEFLAIKSAKAEVYVGGTLQNTVLLRKATEQELGENKDLERKFVEGTGGDIWLNDDAVWVDGEEKWVKNGDNSWSYSGTPPRWDDIRIDITIIDNMGLAYKKTYGHGIWQESN